MAQTSFVVGAVVLVLLALSRFLRVVLDKREPPEARSSIPFVGHIIGLLRHKVFYYRMMRDQVQSPIFTIPMPGSRIYIVSSPQLVTLVQKLVKPLSFAPIVAKFTQHMCGISKEANDIVRDNLLGEKGDRSYVTSFFKATRPSLMPGPALDAMNRIMIQNVGESTDELAKSKFTRINLSRWLRHHVTKATTNATYGAGNPFLDKRVAEAFWTFEQNTLSLLVNMLPSITARPATRARTVVAKAFYEYFSKNKHRKGSSLVQARFDHSREYGIPIEDIARLEVGGVVAVLVNTYPVAFWMIHYICSNPQVLADCRKELDEAIRPSVEADGTVVHQIDMTLIKTSCPTLTSTLQEVLRHRAVGTSFREVMEDTMLDGQYLLKKGSIVLIPSDVLHSDHSLWGEDVDEFNHRRFLKGTERKTANPIAFRAFGGGSTLCPGRHFASTEIMAIASVLIARFDIRPVGGKWPDADVKDAKIWAQIVEPDDKFEVDVRQRPEFAQGKHRWEFGLTTSEMLFAIAAEDKA